MCARIERGVLLLCRDFFTQHLAEQVEFAKAWEKNRVSDPKSTLA